MPTIEQLCRGRSAFESLDRVVEIEESGGCRTQMIPGIDTVAFVLTTPLTLMKASHRVREVTPSHVAFYPQLSDEFFGVRGRNELHQVQTARSERFDHSLI
jgi:hypothetical protein